MAMANGLIFLFVSILEKLFRFSKSSKRNER